jgi:formylglycine-generating enzyme required for sulfatase activity
MRYVKISHSLFRALLVGVLLVAVVGLAFWSWKEWKDDEGMVLVPGGPFLMGVGGEGASMRLIEDPTGDRQTFHDERVEHIEQTESFYVDRYEVTNAQYARYVFATGSRAPGGWQGQPTHPRGEGDYPVVGINQSEAEAYCKWLGKRLPTEEEWEKAARGEEGTLYPWGNQYERGKANTWEEGRRKPVSVYEYPDDTSIYQVHGLAGNVAEWTSTVVQLWTDEIRAVVKGGSWTVDGREWNLSAQILSPVYGYMNHVGFRCVKSTGTGGATSAEPVPSQDEPGIFENS